MTKSFEVRISMRMKGFMAAGQVAEMLECSQNAKVRTDNRKVEGKATMSEDNLDLLIAFLRENGEKGNLQYENPNYPILFKNLHIETKESAPAVKPKAPLRNSIANLANNKK